ncbi:MAG: carbon-nitrogen hydrolase family protein [Planctomycetia bacterium]|nr:carbon-nitrogen hydrolase family protein [Planctomycetia bacterium]
MRFCLLLSIAVGLLVVGAAAFAADEPANAAAKPGARAARPPQKLRVAAVQMRSSRDLAANVAKTCDCIERCARDGARVVVFPECSLTGYFDGGFMKALTAQQLADAERRVATACREHSVYAIVGTPHREGDKLFNSAVVIDPRGRVIERYHKLQLAESWPDEGDHLVVFKVDGVPCSIIVCHDERYPELVRLPVLAGARVIFYVSHESDVTKETKIDPYRAQIQARAVENTVYVVQANAPANEDTSGSHGQSRVIAPDGRVEKEGSIFGEETVTATLDVDRATGTLARRSVERGPLTDWWRAGVARVRIIDDKDVADAAAAQ